MALLVRLTIRSKRTKYLVITKTALDPQTAIKSLSNAISHNKACSRTELSTYLRGRNRARPAAINLTFQSTTVIYLLLFDGLHPRTFGCWKCQMRDGGVIALPALVLSLPTFVLSSVYVPYHVSVCRRIG